MVDKNGLAGGEPVGQQQPPPVLDADVASWRDAAKPQDNRRPKVTAEDVAADFAARRAERQARRDAREPRQMGRLVRIVAASAMGVGIIGFAVGASAAERQYASDAAANRDKVASLSGALAALSPADGEDPVQTLVDGLSAAQARSDELAAGQQRFSVIAHEGNSDPGTNDGRPKASVLKSLEQRRALEGFFAPESLVLTEAEAYTFRTEDLLGPGRIDPRLPWFTRYEPAGGDAAASKASDPEGYSWETASVALSGTPGLFNVVWTNTDTGTGELLSWATAGYSAETGTFQDLVVYRTTLGEKQQLKPATAGTATTEGADA